MTDVTTAPADEVVCATIRNQIERHPGTPFEREYVFTESVDHLYGDNKRRTAARLRVLSDRGLVDGVKHPRRGFGLIWWLTPAGEALADAALPACCKCCGPVEPDLHERLTTFCRSCLIDLIDSDAVREEESATWSRDEATKHEEKARALRAHVGALRVRAVA